ncbi:MAG: trigger factor [Pseudomonadales bacterium]|uniref:Trigger factor n=1 Tax=Oleiphilus messinensis TaxID=141451 RepID=A0A1Y0IA56_9GAMM|nr:trigger factor [Oleiphilus messinensis]ARU56304.1 trigger factor [Oleiphilus messinensis]MCG8611889.1 trigger factor [Pseudomonadales bacterium]
MQVSIEATSNIERKMTIGVPSSQVEQEVEKRLQRTARTVRLNGFRPGKVPMNVVRRRFGDDVRQEVLGEVMRNAYVEALEQEKINPAGYPQFEAKQLESGQDLEFVATFEVYPEIELADLSAIAVEKQVAEIADADVDNMLDVLQNQSATFEEVSRKSKDGDVLTLDYKGIIDGEAFEGGTAEESKITLGKGQMIPGFEDGLVGMGAGDEGALELSFPDDYHAENLAGKAVTFEVKVHKVEEPVLPELNAEFFEKYGVKDVDEAGFKAEIKKNMERELKQATRNKVKQSVVDQLIATNEFAVPASLIDSEVDRMRQDAFRQFGGGMGGNMKASDLPAELFKGQAENRVKTGLLFNELIAKNELKVDESLVDARIEEMAATYEDPSEVIAWYKSNPDQRSQIEGVVLEDMVIDFVLENAQVTENTVSYEEAVKPPSQAPQAAKESE